MIYLSLVFYRYSKLNLYRNLREVCISIFPSSLSRRCTTIQEHATREEGGKKKKKRKTRKRGLLYHTRITLIRFERAWNLNSPVRFRGISSCATSLSLFFHGPNCSPFVSFLERRPVVRTTRFLACSERFSYKSIGMETRWNVD